MAPGRNRWDKQQRTTLHVLHEHFQFDLQQRTAVFNKIFKNHLAACGLPSGLPSKAIRVQYGEHTTKHHIWDDICSAPSTEREWQARNQLTREIRAVAASLGQGRPPPPQSRGLRTVTVAGEESGISRSVVRRPAKRTAVEQVSTPQSRNSKRVASTRVALSVEVEDYRTGVADNAPVTPQSTPSKPRKLAAAQGTIPYARRTGPTLNLTPKQHAKNQLPLAPIPEALAHPPKSGLYYRYWDENSYGLNSEQGFVAGRYMINNVKPRIPKSTELDYADIESHLNRSKTPSPFVSVSNCLVWLLRLALKEAKKGAQHGKITIINADALDRKSVFYMRPFHKQLQNQFCFLNGAWRYPGTHEFVAWHEIPQQALLKTFSMTDLESTCLNVPALAEMLRFDMIAKNSNLKTRIMTSLESAQVSLTPPTIHAMGRMCRKVLGLSGTSDLKHIEHVVQDVIQGWRLLVAWRSAEDWNHDASIFTHALCGRNTLPTPAREKELHMAYLFGVRAGLGDFNTLHDPKSIEKMHRKARAVGLESPTQIILNAMQNVQLAIQTYDEEQAARYASAAAVLLPGIEEYVNLESDVRGESSASAGARAMMSSDEEDHDQIMFDLDDDRLGL